jgi:hypothetical protein
MMARHSAKPTITPAPLAEALRLDLSLTPLNRGQETAQREIATSLESVLDARRQRINISMSQTGSNGHASSCRRSVFILTIAMMHNDNRSSSVLALGLFATGVAVAVLLIATHNRPFTGEISVGPGPLLQVLPEEKTS